MPLPDSVHQVIEQIINVSADAMPELQKPMQDELYDQYEALVTKAITENLSPAQNNTFQQLLDQPSTTPTAVQQFLESNIDDMGIIIDQATDKLRSLYLE